MSVALTLLFCEVGVRVIQPQDGGYWDSRPFRRLRSQSPHFIENIPGARSQFIGVPVKIDSIGLRGDEIDIPKPPRTVRLIAVGDSITFGYGMKLEDTYPKALERRLNDNSKNPIHYEVINAGTLGGALGDYLNLLQQKAQILQPDIVLIGLCLNDILVYSDSGGTVESGTEWRNEHKRWVRRLNYLLLRHSQLYMLVYSSLKKALYTFGILDVNKVQGQNLVALAPASSYQTLAWSSSLNMLERISAFCRVHNYKLLVVVFPGQMQMSQADLDFYRKNYHFRFGNGVLSGEPQQRLHNFATATGLTLVDLLPAYSHYDSQQLYFHNDKVPSDPLHPSVLGNEVAAEEILPLLKSLM